jgi:phosphoribulokinase
VPNVITYPLKITKINFKRLNCYGFSNSLILRPVPAAHSSFIIPCAGVRSLIVAHRLAQFQEKFLGHAARILLCRAGLA